MAQQKSERTREAIRDAAIRSFRERGYEATTIRILADELGIAVGSAYYHCPSKSHLVQELYGEVARTVARTAREALTQERKLPARINAVLTASLAELEPYGAHASEFLLAAGSPTADANPLSEASAAPRQLFLELFQETVAGADERLPADIAELLPEALYRVNLLASLTWVQDRSEGHARTHRLIAHGTRLLGLAMPALKIGPIRRTAVSMLSDVGQIG